MITIDTVVSAKKQYVIDNVMPSDLDSNIEEGLKKKEELIRNITNESIIEEDPDILQTIDTLNSHGLTEEDYFAFLKGDASLTTKQSVPEPAVPEVKYCIDDKELKKYTKNSIIELQIPKEGEKKVTIATLTKFTGDCVDTYALKNAYWSIIPKDVQEPEVPDFLKINYRGSAKTEDELLQTADMGKINYIRNGFTWTSIADLVAIIEKDGSVETDTDELTRWQINGLLPSSQSKLPNFKVTVNMNEGDMMYVESEHLNYIFYQNNWTKLPVGMADLRADATNQFVSVKSIEFSEDHAQGEEDQNCTGGSYCITSQYQSKKFETVESNTFVYLHLTATKQEEKKQKSCSKSNNCSKQSSACDKGQTDVAEQHNPNVNEEWHNKMMDLLIKIELHPMQKSLRDLAEAIIQLCSGATSLSAASCSDGYNVACPEAASTAASALEKANLVLWQITERKWYNKKLTPTGDDAVDMSTSIIFDPAESAINAAVDAAISQFNDIVNESVNSAITAAMASADAASASCSSAASACSAACKAAGNSAMAKAVEAASSSCSAACNQALSTCNEECLNKTKELLGEFSQKICDTRMQDTGDAASLASLTETIASATAEASAGATEAAQQLASSYMNNVNKACESLNNVVSQANSIIG